MKWNWLRLATLVSGAACVAVGALIPGAQAVLIPLGTGLVGVAWKTPGFEPSSRTVDTDPGARKP
jgi:hypothetical protein